jgi:hypothetical protein
MFKRPIRTGILNAAAVFSGQHGAVTRQAEQARCSRQTVDQHAHKLEQRLGDEPAAAPPTEERPRPAAAAAAEPAAGPRILLDKDVLRGLSTLPGSNFAARCIMYACHSRLMNGYFVDTPGITSLLLRPRRCIDASPGSRSPAPP